MTALEDKVLGAVLAGGRSSRLAPLDKRWLVWRGAPLWWHSVCALTEQCAYTAVTVDSTPERYSDFARAAGRQILVAADPGKRHQGPLAGVSRGLALAQEQGCQWLLTAPCDCIGVPPQLRQLLLTAGTPAAYIEQAGDAFYTLGLWHVSLLPRLAARVTAGDTSLRRAFSEAGAISVKLPLNAEGPMLVNINSIEAWRRLSAAGGTEPACST